MGLGMALAQFDREASRRLADQFDGALGGKLIFPIPDETTLKRYVVEHGRPYLKAENPLFPDLMPARELRIQGVMVSLVRKQKVTEAPKS